MVYVFWPRASDEPLPQGAGGGLLSPRFPSDESAMLVSLLESSPLPRPAARLKVFGRSSHRSDRLVRVVLVAALATALAGAALPHPSHATTRAATTWHVHRQPADRQEESLRLIIGLAWLLDPHSTVHRSQS